MYFTFLMKKNCKAYRKIYDNKDKSFLENDKIRNSYLYNKDFGYSLLDNQENISLDFFEKNIRSKIPDLILKLKNGFITLQNISFLHTTRLNSDKGIVFYNSLLDFISGDELLIYVLIFDISTEKVKEVHYSFQEEKIMVLRQIPWND